jgi:hypothetical protein
MRAVSEAVVMLTPSVKATLFIPTPTTLTPAMETRSLLPGQLFGLRMRTSPRSRSPARVNLRATKGSGGTPPTAYLTVTKFVPRKKTARSSEASVTRAVLSLDSVTNLDSTPGPPEAHSAPPEPIKDPRADGQIVVGLGNR